MSRIAACFERLRGQGRKALVPYITAGDPDPGLTVPLMHAMVEAGANILELGVPFSDPMADGPVIQRASERALSHGVSLHDVLQMVREFRKQDATTPVVLMGYLNPVEVMGYEAFARAAAEAGVDGVLTVDMPPEEGVGYSAALRAAGLDTIFLVAPTSSAARIKMLGQAASGFVYYVSLKGVTGAGHLDVNAVADKVARMRQDIRLPIGVGFGIKDAASAAQVGAAADAVVVGSALVRKIEEHHDDHGRIIAEIVSLLSSMRRALDDLN
ncbi:MAG: tryptophan synthase subunit alpha [Pseudomonadota bacterium]